jgi:hypothetical protein
MGGPDSQYRERYGLNRLTSAFCREVEISVPDYEDDDNDDEDEDEDEEELEEETEEEGEEHESEEVEDRENSLYGRDKKKDAKPADKSS